MMMLFLFILFVFLMCINGKFRVFGCIIIATSLIVAAIFFSYIAYSSKKNSDHYNKELKAIPISKIIILNAELSKSYSYWKIGGDIINNSSFKLDRVNITIQVHECKIFPRKNKECIIINESKVPLYIEIPSGQKRTFETYTDIPTDFEFHYGREWSYLVTEIHADIPKS